MAAEPAERPNTIPWPPILFFAALLGGAIISRAFRIPFLDASYGMAALGWCVIFGALGVMAWAFLAFNAAKTTILPHQASTALIRTGPFAFSRNPIYLSELAILVGLGLVSQPVWWWLAAFAFHRAITKLAIEREEAHLAARFGADWTDYAAKVRRWCERRQMIRVRTLPTPATDPSSTSPLTTAATPSGVPVKIRSPGWSATRPDR